MRAHLYHISYPRSFYLAFSDVQTNWTWVVVLEECQASSRSSRKLIRDSLPSWTREGSGNGPRPRGDILDAEVGLDASLGGVGGGTASDPAQLLEVDSAVAGEGV